MPDPVDQLEAALSGRYTIERELGRGGNAVVYLAHDVKHNRKVALKVLRRELALAVRAERFLREIQIAAKLTHPHILAVYDSGEAGGMLFYAMPHVSGETLRDLLVRARQLPLEDALRVTREVADALDYAHRQRIIHRDIKPENILIHEGHALVADFGIARALSVSTSPVTESGIAVGTPAYMSPEQGGAEGTLDARSDVYALGCVVYEMLAGRPPFLGATAQEVLSRHALDDVPSLRAARPDVPDHIARAVTRALAKVPAARFQTAGEFTRALDVALTSNRVPVLRWIIPAAAAVVLFTLGFTMATRAGWIGVRAAAAADNSIAVLRCKELTTNPESLAYLGEGVAEELITGLNRVEGLRVKGRHSSFSLASQNPVREAVEKLGVSHVVECTVAQAGERLRIGARLVDARGDQVWGQTFEGMASNPFEIQDSVARAVVAHLQETVAVRPPAGPLVLSTTSSTRAYDLYRMGRYHWNKRTFESMNRAFDYFQQAIRQDSSYALAYSGLADVYSYSAAGRNFLPVPAAEAYRLAKQSAEKAIDLDSTTAEAWVSLARVRYVVDWDFDGAEAAFKRAIQLNPKYPLAYSWYGQYLAWVMSPVGRSEDAIREARKGLDLDPFLPTTNNSLAQALRFAGREEESIQYYLKAIELEPDVSDIRGFLGTAYAGLGNFSAALAQIDSADARRGSSAQPGMRAYIYARTGRVTEARRLMESFSRQRAQGDPRAGTSLVQGYLAFGEKDSAFTALFRAVERRAFTAGPSFNQIIQRELRDDPRWDLLLRKAGVKK